MARCSDMILAVAESFDCSLIHLNHTAMSLNDDYAGSDDVGSAGGAVLTLKSRQKAYCTCKQETAEGMSVLALPTLPKNIFILFLLFLWGQWLFIIFKLYIIYFYIINMYMLYLYKRSG